MCETKLLYIYNSHVMPPPHATPHYPVKPNVCETVEYDSHSLSFFNYYVTVCTCTCRYVTMYDIVIYKTSTYLLDTTLLISSVLIQDKLFVVSLFESRGHHSTVATQLNSVCL